MMRGRGVEAACPADDQDSCLTFYQFPKSHWLHLRTINVIESPFASVRLRTNAAKRFKRTKSTVHLFWEVLLRLQKNWRRLKSTLRCGTVVLSAAGKKRKAHEA